MKPLGPIPPGFASIDGELAIGGRKASALVAEAGSPLFVYDGALISARVAALRAALPERLGLHYAMKANPFAPLLRHMAGLVDGFDIASGGELAMAEAAGVLPEQISFAGPGKRDADLEAAIARGVTLNLESAREGEREFRHRGAAQLSQRDCHEVWRSRGGRSQYRRLLVHAAGPAGGQGRLPARGGRRPGRSVLRRGIRRECEPDALPRAWPCS